MSTIATPVREQLTVRIKLATNTSEREGAYLLRRQVFCEEQGLFDQDDCDDIDAVALTLVAITVPDDEVVGTVRIHPAGDGTWWGSRLAVVRAARRQASVGSGLIKLAVGTAQALGCRNFLAHVQRQNVPMFEQLHWQALREVAVHGHLHCLMRAELSFYPPIHDGQAGFLCSREHA